MSFQDQILLWNHAALRVLDIRRTIMQPGENVHAYQLPASVFLYVTRGRAQIMLDDIVYTADKCHVCHAGKGTFLDIVNVLETLEYFMVFYKAALALPVRKELLQLQEKSKPFKLQFGFIPQHSISLFLKLEEMHRQWRQIGTLEKFHVKALFHQFVYEMLQQLQDQGSQMIGMEPVGQAIRYMQERYAEQISLYGLAELLDCNARQLQRLFKAKLSMGPMEYLTQVRLGKAKSLLQHTDVPLAEIAEDVGYTDSYYFSRVFKKHVGVSPGRFREQSGQLDFRRQNPRILSQIPIVPSKLQTYSGYIDQLLALGRLPVGSVIATSDALEFPNYVSRQLSDIKVMGTKEKPDLEAIKRAEPELIVCTEFQAHMYDELVRIAPTLLLDRNADWRRTLQTFGQILGKEQEVPGVMGSYQNKIAKLQAELAGRMAGETVALIRPRDNQIRLHTTSHRTADILYSDLEIQAPECAMDTERPSKWISLEALQQVDRLFVLTDDSNKELTGEFQKSELWKGLRAVQANHVYTFNTTMWIGYYGPIAIDLIVDELAESLLQENPPTV